MDHREQVSSLMAVYDVLNLNIDYVLVYKHPRLLIFSEKKTR